MVLNLDKEIVLPKNQFPNKNIHVIWKSGIGFDSEESKI